MFPELVTQNVRLLSSILLASVQWSLPYYASSFRIAFDTDYPVFRCPFFKPAIKCFSVHSRNLSIRGLIWSDPLSATPAVLTAPSPIETQPNAPGFTEIWTSFPPCRLTGTYTNHSLVKSRHRDPPLSALSGQASTGPDPSFARTCIYKNTWLWLYKWRSLIRSTCQNKQVLRIWGAN